MRKIALGIMIAVLFLGFIFDSASAVLGWVGGLWPNGTSNSINGANGNTYDVYCQVYKSGVTDSAGQGAGIVMYLAVAEVDSFGGAWNNQQDYTMTYNVDDGNNDEYMVTLTVGTELSAFQRYEYKCYAIDTTDDDLEWADGNNGGLTVLGPNAITLTTLTAATSTSWIGFAGVLALGMLVAVVVMRKNR